MRLLYDTEKVQLPDRFEHYCHGAARELAPVQVGGPAPRRMSAKMSSGPVGDFGFEVFTWTADTEVFTVRTERLIRSSDPEQYRLILVLDGEIDLEQRGRRSRSGPDQIGLFDLSVPWRAVHRPETGRMRIAMLTFPHTLLRVDERRVRSVVGTFLPQDLPGRDVMRKLLVRLADAVEPVDYAGVLAECTVGLISHWLGLPGGVTGHTRTLLHRAMIRGAIRARLGDEALDPGAIARAVHMSPRYLHKLLEGTGSTAMQLVKQLRLEEGRRRLEAADLPAIPVGQIATACGYRSLAHFTRDFGEAFGLTPTQARAGRGDAGSTIH
jgi:AraC-like DNA-binding protein